MGGILSKKPVQKLNKEAIITLKKNTMKDIFDCIEIVHHKYPHSSLLDFEKFEDIFSDMIPDCASIFEQIKQKYGKESDPQSKYLVDLYECLAIFALFSSEQYEIKIAFIFRLFDFDLSETIEPTELTLSLQCVVRGLCKMAGIIPPGYGYLENISKTCFQIMDLDHNSHIEFEEYISWISSNEEFQDFLLKYSGTITYSHSKKIFNKNINKMNDLYEKLRENNEKKEVYFEELKKALLLDELKYFDKEIQDCILDLIIYTNETNELKGIDVDEVIKNEKSSKKNDLMMGSIDVEFKKDNRPKTFEEIIVSNKTENDEFPSNTKILKKEAFLNVMRAWGAFSATDYNCDNYLSINELKVLLWIYEEEEPNEWRVNSEMKEIDKDNSASIDRIEWLKHLCVEDEKTGKQIFREEIRKLFLKFDIDKSGYLSGIELKKLVKTMFAKYLKKAKDEKTMFNLSMMINSLSNDIIDELDIDGEKNLSWEEFKYFIDKTLEKQVKLINFLNEVL